MTREKVLDRDNDGQADYLDKHFNYSTFKVPEDTRREFEPVKQDRQASCSTAPRCWSARTW